MFKRPGLALPTLISTTNRGSFAPNKHRNHGQDG